jgi:hypothetical protein
MVNGKIQFALSNQHLLYPCSHSSKVVSLPVMIGKVLPFDLLDGLASTECYQTDETNPTKRK